MKLHWFKRTVPIVLAALLAGCAPAQSGEEVREPESREDTPDIAVLEEMDVTLYIPNETADGFDEVTETVKAQPQGLGRDELPPGNPQHGRQIPHIQAHGNQGQHQWKHGLNGLEHRPGSQVAQSPGGVHLLGENPINRRDQGVQPHGHPGIQQSHLPGLEGVFQPLPGYCGHMADISDIHKSNSVLVLNPDL